MRIGEGSLRKIDINLCASNGTAIQLENCCDSKKLICTCLPVRYWSINMRVNWLLLITIKEII